MAEKNLTQEEVDQRILVLKRFRQLLEQQRSKFREYLCVLEKQEAGIETENPEMMAVHTELAEQIVANISTLQRVIRPMEALYHTAGLPAGNAAAAGTEASGSADAGIAAIQGELDDLQEKVRKQNEKNRQLLAARMLEIRSRMSTVKNPYRNSRSIYSTDSQSASIIHLQV